MTAEIITRRYRVQYRVHRPYTSPQVTYTYFDTLAEAFTEAEKLITPALPWTVVEISRVETECTDVRV